MKNIPIVGIGASAGGLKALEYFFKTMPDSQQVAFVIVQHLSPNYKSTLADIVNRYTVMDVCQIKNNMTIEAGKIYVIPPANLVTIENGKLLLSPIKIYSITSLEIATGNVKNCPRWIENSNIKCTAKIHSK